MRKLLASIATGLSLGAMLGALAAAVVFLCVYFVGVALAAEGTYYPDPAPAAPTAPVTIEDTGVTIFKSANTIRSPRVIEVDGTVSCRIDGDTLRCTARRPPIPEKDQKP